MSPLILSLLSEVIISLISVVGIFAVISRLPSFSKISLSLVGIAVGSLLGDAFIHLLPQAYLQISNPTTVSLLVISGILLFFSIEKFVRWRHCHDPDCHESQSSSDHLVPISLVGELFHNFIDGVIIASSFNVNFALGITTSLAVLLHEIPQEIGHFSIYTHAGLSLKQSFFYNLFSSLSSIFGVFFLFLIGQSIVHLSDYIIPITAGGFIYLAASDLIPELHRHQPHHTSSVFQILFVIIGVAIMYSLLLLE